MPTRSQKICIVFVLASLCIWLSGGCESLEYHKIYMAGAGGAAIGAIVGHQSDECGAGAGVGAAVFAVGELLHQVDDLNKQKMQEAARRAPEGGSPLDPNRVD